MKNNKISLFLSLVFVIFIGINIADAAIVALGQQKEVLGGNGPIGSRPNNPTNDKCSGYNFLRSDCKFPEMAINPCKFYPMYFEKCGCSSDFKYTCIANNEVGGSDSCGGRYSSCKCRDGYVRNNSNNCVIANNCFVELFPITKSTYNSSSMSYNNTSYWSCAGYGGSTFCKDEFGVERTSCRCILPSCGDYNLGSKPPYSITDYLVCSNDACKNRGTKYKVIGCIDGAEMSSPDVCTQCPAGKFSIGGVACQSCPEGSYQDGVGKTSCKACKEGQTSITGSKICSGIECSSGYNLTTSSCSVGSRLVSQSTNTNCKKCEACTLTCPVGYPNLVDPGCSATFANKIWNETGCGSSGSNSEKCYSYTKCASGYSCTNKVCIADRCPAGQYKNGYGCTQCPAGSYCPADSTSPIQCPIDLTSSAGSSSFEDCVCPLRAYTNLPAKSCAVGDIYYSDKTCSPVLNANKTPIGVVAYVENGHGLVFDLRTTYLMWGSMSTSSIPGIKPEWEDVGALVQRNGKCHTAKIVTFGDASLFPAAHYCNDYTTAGTLKGDWYLPALGELKDMMNNFAEVDTTLIRLNAAEISVNYHWSSSQGGGIAWVFMRQRKAEYSYKDNQNTSIRCVLAF